MLILKSSLFFLNFLLAVAQSVTPLSLETKEGEKLIIKGAGGDLQIILEESPQRISLELKSTSSQRLVPARKDDGIVVSLEGSASVDKNSDTKLVIKSASRPIEIYWDHGSVSLNGWRQSVHFNGKNVKLNLTNVAGSIKAHSYQGIIQINNFKGSAHLAAFKSQIIVNQGQGPVKIENFSGETKLDNVEGTVEVQQQSGNASINSVKGSLDFDNGEGSLKVDKIIGVVKGKNNSGEVSLKVAQADRIDIKSEGGEIKCVMPEKSGHRVLLKSETGIVEAPGYLPMTRQDKGRTVKGELKGGSEGTIKIVANSGNIYLR